MPSLVKASFAILYWLVAALNLLPGLLGLVCPFGIVGDTTPFWETDGLHLDKVELIQIHCARMDFACAVGFGVILILCWFEPMRIRARILAVISLAAVVFSLGEVYLDAPAAARLGVGPGLENPSRSEEFLIGAIDGGSATMLCIAGAAFVVSLLTAVTAVDEGRKKQC